MFAPRQAVIAARDAASHSSNTSAYCGLTSQLGGDSAALTEGAAEPRTQKCQSPPGWAGVNIRSRPGLSILTGGEPAMSALPLHRSWRRLTGRGRGHDVWEMKQIDCPGLSGTQEGV
jgi:hypothetical protein